MSTREEIEAAVARAIAGAGLPSKVANLDRSVLMSTPFGDLGFDSFAMMEFCIEIQLQLGIDLEAAEVADLGTPVKVVERIAKG